jgi:hypothetical protein
MINPDISIDALLKAKAELEKIGPIQRYVEVTPKQYAAMREMIPTVVVPREFPFGLRVRIIGDPATMTFLDLFISDPKT